MGTRECYKFFNIAKDSAICKEKKDYRNFRIGAVGIRSDGIIVKSRNASDRNLCPAGHAEAKLIKKLDRGSVVYVCRIRKSGGFGMAKPCKNCELLLRNKGIKEVYYSINDEEFGRLNLNE